MIQKQSKKGIIRVPRERIVKDPPKRGKLTKRQVQRAVEKVVPARRDSGEVEQTPQPIQERTFAEIDDISEQLNER